MPHVLERFSGPDMSSLAADLGGILFTPSVFISCLISNVSRSSLYGNSVLNILGRSTDFMLNGYMIEIDKNIVRDNLINANQGEFITPEKFGIIQGALDSIKTLNCRPCIEAEAHKRSCQIALYDARRLETAFHHNLTVLTCEPEHFTIDPNELNHIFSYEYADVSVGEAAAIDVPEESLAAKVWVFKPEALSTLLNHFGPGTYVRKTDRSTTLSLTGYQLTSTLSGSRARVELLLDDRVLVGESNQLGPIDATLRAVERALMHEINLSGIKVHHRVSDTTTERDTARVSVRVNIPSQYASQVRSPFNFIEANDESADTLLSTARAYVKALDILLRELRRWSR